MQYNFKFNFLINEENDTDLVERLKELTEALSKDGFKVTCSPEKHPDSDIPERMIIRGKEDPFEYIIASDLPYELVEVKK